MRTKHFMLRKEDGMDGGCTVYTKNERGIWYVESVQKLDREAKIAHKKYEEKKCHRRNDTMFIKMELK